MIVFLVVACAVLFVWAVLATALALFKTREGWNEIDCHRREKDGINKVGQWYENRVAELENETRQLAEQIITGGGLARHAMPIQGPEPYREYRFDDTGLVVEQVDPSDYAAS